MHARHVTCATICLTHGSATWLTAYCSIIFCSDVCTDCSQSFVTRKTTIFSARYSAICLLLNASLHECLRVKVKMSVCTHVRICFSGKIIYRELNFKDLLSHHCKQPLFVQAGFREATGYRFARASKLRGIMWWCSENRELHQNRINKNAVHPSEG